MRDLLHSHDAHILEFEGIENFRDIGGYKTTNGSIIRWGRFFRSGQLANMSQFDSEQLAPLAISRLFDLRTSKEREEFPTRWGEGAAPEVFTIDVIDKDADAIDDLFEQIMNGSITRDQVLEHMLEDYSNMPFDYVPILQSLFAALATEDTSPLLVHCTAGKDRTGFVCALLMSLLGIPHGCIIEDYLLSIEGFAAEEKLAHIGEQYASKTEDIDARLDALRPLISVDADYIDAAFAAIEMRMGSMDAYFKQTLALSEQQIDSIRQALLVPCGVAN